MGDVGTLRKVLWRVAKQSVISQEFVTTFGCPCNGVSKRNLNTGKAPEENRGCDVRGSKFVDKKAAVRNFVKKLRSVQSHYNRGKNTTKQYLPSEQTIMSLWKSCCSETAKHLHDVAALLCAHYGEEWIHRPTLQYYKSVIEDPSIRDNDDNAQDVHYSKATVTPCPNRPMNAGNMLPGDNFRTNLSQGKHRTRCRRLNINKSVPSKNICTGMKEICLVDDIHSTRLKDHIVEPCLHLEAQGSPRKESFIDFTKYVGNTLWNFMARHCNKELINTAYKLCLACGNRARLCLWSTGFSGISYFPRLCIPVLLQTHLIRSQDLEIKRHPNISTPQTMP
ncbi:hypothetical protein PR048_030145 [Dryococelus australis]|uniref:V(D)J recombination-activating protein 1 n=1 Tax=Dryococelus australis TaxID=614101 RepID=A0ABQ9G8W7_9NEOP|nr:hypothetical protein PR048_030145 [Dryococelus australis]